MHQVTGKLITTHLTQRDAPISTTTATSTEVFPSHRWSCVFALNCGATVWMNLVCILRKVIPSSGSVFALGLRNTEKNAKPPQLDSKIPSKKGDSFLNAYLLSFLKHIKKENIKLLILDCKNATISYTSVIYSRTLPCYTPDSYHYFHTCFLSILSSCLHPFESFSFLFLFVLVLNLAFPFPHPLSALSSLYNLPKVSAFYFPTCIYFLALGFSFSLNSLSFLLSFPSYSWNDTPAMTYLKRELHLLSPLSVLKGWKISQKELNDYSSHCPGQTSVTPINSWRSSAPESSYFPFATSDCLAWKSCYSNLSSH